MPIATRNLVPSQRSSAQPISPQASTPATKVPMIDQTMSAPPPRRPPPPPRPAMGARMYHLRAFRRRPGLIHRGATARLCVATRHLGTGLALEPPGPFVLRGATARLCVATRHLGTGLALEPPGPPGAHGASPSLTST